jgi:predicted DNA repair protein MutK
VRIPADAPTVVDDVTAKRAQAALRRAGIVTR